MFYICKYDIFYQYIKSINRINAPRNVLTQFLVVVNRTGGLIDLSYFLTYSGHTHLHSAPSNATHWNSVFPL